MTQWLLKNEGYPPAVLVSLLLHGLVLAIIFFWNRDSKELLRIEQPAAIVAITAKENPQRVRQQETKRKQQQQVAQEREKVKEQERQHQEILLKEETERQKIVQQKQQKDADQKRKQDELKQQEQKQQATREQDIKREKEKQQQVAKEQAQRESDLAKQQAANQRALTEEQLLVARYQDQIRDLIESYWSRPSSARKEMVAMVELQLTPTGEIISKSIIKSSGDANFDRSVLVAVDKAGRFDFLKELNYAVFNTYFRKFSLEFKPGDL